MQTKPQAKTAEVSRPAAPADVKSAVASKQPQPLDAKALQQVAGGRLNPYNTW
jgi:hypothetical protein